MEGKKGMAYLLVGKDRNWGKSRTLRALTGDSTKPRRITIESRKDGKTYEFFIKRASNTDDPAGFDEFIRTSTYENIIIAFSIGDENAALPLAKLFAKYRLRCFVLHHRWNKSADQETPEAATANEVTPEAATANEVTPEAAMVNEVTPEELELLGCFAVPGGVQDYTIQAGETVRAADFLSYLKVSTPF